MTDRCSHCRRRLRGHVSSVERDGTIAGVPTTIIECFHGDRRACRVASYEAHDPTWATLGWPVPVSTERIGVRTYGGALMGFDYIRWPWWLRWLPGRCLDSLRTEVALRVGRAVELAAKETE